MTRTRVWSTAAGVVLCLASVLLAVQSVNVQQTTPADFAPGTFEDVVANNLGELKLTRRVDALLKADKDVVFVNALVADDKGVIYAATAPKGKLFRISADGKCELYWTAKDKTLQSLAIGPKNELYVGTGGGEGRIYRVAARDTAELVLDRPKLAYVWAMTVLPDGRIVAGTGPSAELLLVAPGDKPVAGDVLFKPEKEKQKNILCVLAAKDGKTVYFGTDTDGLVFKYDLAARRPFLVYDANESEIACLALGADGVVYAGTSDPALAGGAASPRTLHVQGQPASQPGGAKTDDDDDESAEGSGDANDDGAKDADDGGGSSLDDNAKKGSGEPDEPNKSLVPSKQEFMRTKPTVLAAGTSDAKSPQPTSRPDGTGARSPTTQSGGKSALGKKDAASPVVVRLPGGMGGGPGRPTGGAEQGGNAVYRIDAGGFVTELVRQPTMMMCLVVRDSQVVIGTGTDGRILAVTPGSEEIATLAKPKDVKQVLTMVPGADNTLVIGTANGAMIARVGNDYVPKGTFTSKPIDAKQISRWGIIRERSVTPQGATVRVQTRSGNLAEPDDNLWSAWTEPLAAGEPVTLASPSARFVQYRLVLAADRADSTPVVKSVTLSYANENQAPKISLAKAAAPGDLAGDDSESRPGGGSAPSAMKMVAPSRPKIGGGPRPGGDGEESPGGAVSILWKAADPNDDTLEYTLLFRRAGTQAWVPLTEKPIREDKFAWTTRGVPDGQYQVKVTASDLPGNSALQARQDSRITDVFTVDNTAPVIANFRIVERKGNRVTLAADATDALTRLVSATARVDSNADGQTLEPADGIWDTRNESLKFAVDLPAKTDGGAHLVILQVTDAAGNVASAAIEVANQ